MTQRSSGGAGWGGLFESAGDFTTSYFDRLDKERSFAEQQRQFNEQQNALKRQLAQQEQRDEIDRFDRLDKSLQRMEDDLAMRGEYMSDDQRAAYTSFIQAGRGATQSYWATGDKSGFEAFTEKFGPGKAWGTDATGQPITLDTINESVYQNKPRLDMEKRIKSSAGDTMAAMVSTILTDPTSTPQMKEWAKGMADGKFTDYSQALAGALAGNQMGPSMLKQSLTKTGINGKSLAAVEDVLKLLGDTAAKNPDGTENPDYKYLQSLLADPKNQQLIKDARTGTEYQLSGQYVQQREVGGLQISRMQFDNDVARTDEVRRRVIEGRADRDDFFRLVKAGDVAAVKASYAQYRKILTDNAAAGGYTLTEDEIRASFDSDVARATQIQQQQDKVMEAQATIMVNSATSSTITTEQATITFNAIKPFLAQNSAAAARLEGLLTKNKITEAEFSALVLPTMLELTNSVDRGRLLQTLADQPGGIGRTALRAASEAGLIDADTYKNLDEYAAARQELYQQGIKVQGQQLNVASEEATAAWWTARGSTNLQKTLAQRGYVSAQANAMLATADATTAQATVNRLVAEGQAVDAYQVGLSGNRVVLAQNATAQLAAQYEGQLITLRVAQDVPEAQINAELQALRARGAQAVVDTLVAEGQQGQARRAGEASMTARIAADMTSTQRNNYESLLIAARVRRSIPEATAQVEVRELAARDKESFVRQLQAEGIIPLATEWGRAQTQAEIERSYTASTATQYERRLYELRKAQKVPEAQIQSELDTFRAKSKTDQVTYLQQEGLMPYAVGMGSSQGAAYIAQNLTAADVARYEGELIQMRRNQGAREAQIQSEIDTFRAKSATDKVTYLQQLGIMPYAQNMGATSAQATLAEDTLRLRTANAAVKLVPLQFQAERQKLYEAISTGKYNEALSILKTKNLVRDDTLAVAGTMQALAELDPNAELADALPYFKNNPAMARAYRSAVALHNTQRYQDYDLAVARSNGKGTSGLSVGNLNSAINSMQGQINSIWKRPDIEAARKRVAAASGISIANDPITGMSNVVMAMSNPKVRAQYAQDVKILQAAILETQPLKERIDAYSAERDAMVSGQPNGGAGGTAPTYSNVQGAIGALGGGAKYTITQMPGGSHAAYDIVFIGANGNKSVPVKAAPFVGAKVVQVTRAGQGDDGMGNSVKVRLADGSTVSMQHFALPSSLKVGQILTGSETIGIQGNTGNTSYDPSKGRDGIHVHLDGRNPDGSPMTQAQMDRLLMGSSSSASAQSAPSRPAQGAPAPQQGKAQVQTTGTPAQSAGPRAKGVPAGNVTGGGTVYSGGGAQVAASGFGAPQLAAQVGATISVYVQKVRQQGNSNPWDNQAGPVRAYNGLVPTSEAQKAYVANVQATYKARPWIAAITQAKGARKTELQTINAEADKQAKAAGIDPNVIKAIMWHESMGWQANLPGDGGNAFGLGQVTGYKPGGYGPNFSAPYGATTTLDVPQSAVAPKQPIQAPVNTGVTRTAAAMATTATLPVVKGVTTKYSTAGLKAITGMGNYKRVLEGIEGGDPRYTSRWATEVARDYLRSVGNSTDAANVERVAGDVIAMAQAHLKATQQYGINSRKPTPKPAPITATEITRAIPSLSALGGKSVNAVSDLKGRTQHLRNLGDTPALKNEITGLVTMWLTGQKDPRKMTADQAAQAGRIANQVKAYVLGGSK